MGKGDADDRHAETRGGGQDRAGAAGQRGIDQGEAVILAYQIAIDGEDAGQAGELDQGLSILCDLHMMPPLVRAYADDRRRSRRAIRGEPGAHAPSPSYAPGTRPAAVTCVLPYLHASMLPPTRGVAGGARGVYTIPHGRGSSACPPSSAGEGA